MVAPIIERQPVALFPVAAGQDEPEFQMVGLHLIPETPVPVKPSLLTSIQGRGVVTPVILRDDGSGGFRVIDGLRRIAASRKLGLHSVPAIIRRESGSVADAMTLDSNANRSANPVAEYHAIARLMGQGVDERAISVATGLPVGTIRKRLKLATLPVDVIERIGTGQVSVGTAEAMATLPRESINRLATKLAEQGKLTNEDVDGEKRVRRADAVGSLPGDAFAVPDMPIPVTRLRDRLADFREEVDAVADAKQRKALMRAVAKLEALIESVEPARVPDGQIGLFGDTDLPDDAFADSPGEYQPDEDPF